MLNQGKKEKKDLTNDILYGIINVRSKLEASWKLDEGSVC